MIIKILTLFPEMFKGFVGQSIIKRAIDKKVCEFEIIDMRSYSLNKHHHVDDTPCGGGAGMVLACDVVDRAITANSSRQTYKVLMTPQGKTYNQPLAKMLAKQAEVMLICGHYEGFDERIRDYVDDEISIGDYILTGGELPSMVVADSIVRLLDEAIKEQSHLDDSFSNGLLEYPQYTRPIEYKGKSVPQVLLSGNHKLIANYRKKEALRKTYLRRPDLLKNYCLNKEEEKLLNEIIDEETSS